MAECEAERRIKQAVFLLEQSLGSGKFDLAEIKDVLIGRNTIKCPNSGESEVK